MMSHNKSPIHDWWSLLLFSSNTIIIPFSILSHHTKQISNVLPTSINILYMKPQWAHSLFNCQLYRVWQYTKQIASFSVERINLNSSQYVFYSLSCNVLNTGKLLTWLNPPLRCKSTNRICHQLKSGSTIVINWSFSSSPNNCGCPLLSLGFKTFSAMNSKRGISLADTLIVSWLFLLHWDVYRERFSNYASTPARNFSTTSLLYTGCCRFSVIFAFTISNFVVAFFTTCQ